MIICPRSRTSSTASPARCQTTIVPKHATGRPNASKPPSDATHLTQFASTLQRQDNAALDRFLPSAGRRQRNAPGGGGLLTALVRCAPLARDRGWGAAATCSAGWH